MASLAPYDLSTFGLDEHQRDRATHVALWVGQVLLAVVVGVAGAVKLALPLDDLIAIAPSLAVVPGPLITAIGAAELFGALGLILPSLTGIRPGLTPIAAAAIALEMLIAAAFHARLGAPEAMVLPVALAALAVWIAWGRWKVSRIAPRVPPPIPPPIE